MLPPRFRRRARSGRGPGRRARAGRRAATRAPHPGRPATSRRRNTITSTITTTSVPLIACAVATALGPRAARGDHQRGVHADHADGQDRQLAEHLERERDRRGGDEQAPRKPHQQEDAGGVPQQVDRARRQRSIQQGVEQRAAEHRVPGGERYVEEHGERRHLRACTRAGSRGRARAVPRSGSASSRGRSRRL